MFIAPLCSGSSANSTFVGDKKNGILIDVGCSYKQLCEYLSLHDTELSAVKAVLITHEHIDHVKGLFQFTKHNNTPVFASAGTCGAILKKGFMYNPERLFTTESICDFISDYNIKAFETPHDSVQSVGYTVTLSNGYRIAYITDLGEITDEVRSATLGANFVLIESNYDPVLLRNNKKYPAFTKERILSRIGHLSNKDSADYIQKLIENGATRVVLAHLSRENNTPETAFAHTVSTLASAGLKHNYDYTLDIANVCSAGEYIAV
ncbi:MAG: MBL fold metallo-hydrolase [Oscillospiraceae bacterium]|nr:MBL fold metallo-hydrolase [Oscillospiraceae bacterium]